MSAIQRKTALIFIENQLANICFVLRAQRDRLGALYASVKVKALSIICLKYFAIRHSFCLWGSLSLSQPYPLITARGKKNKQKKNFHFLLRSKVLQLFSTHIYYTDFFSVYFCIINTSSHTNGYHANMGNNNSSQFKCFKSLRENNRKTLTYKSVKRVERFNLLTAKRWVAVIEAEEGND